jgi:hypothetical protein
MPTIEAPTSVVLGTVSCTGATVTFTNGVNSMSHTCAIFESNDQYYTGQVAVSTQSPATNASISSGQAFTFPVVAGKYYSANVFALRDDAGVISGYSTMSAGVVPTLSAPGAPTSVVLSSLTSGGAIVSWVAGVCADSYTCQIYRSTTSDMQTSRTLVSPQTPSNSTAVPESGVTLEQAFLFTATDGYYYGAIVTATNEIGSTASSTTSNFTGSLYTADVICFKEDTKILCKINNTEQYIPIQALRNGDLVKTSLNGFKSIYMIGWKEINHIISEKRTPNQLYVCSKANFPEATEDLIVTGAHSILVGALTDTQREEIVEVLGKIYITGDKYRLPACVDERTTIYEKEGLCNIYHFALENDNYYMNYGIYANGILVETSSQRYIKEISTMTIIQ